MSISRDAYKTHMLQWHPRQSIQGEFLETSSHAEYPSFKKRRICDNFVPNRSIQVANDSFKVKQGQPRCQMFDDDSKRLCRMFCIGRSCSYGDKCRFLHVIPHKIWEFSNTNAVRTAARSGDLECNGFVSNGSEGNLKSAFWKTKLCFNWKMSGSCPYGNACRFAHGQAELQNFGACFGLESWIEPACSLKNVDNDDRNTTTTTTTTTTTGNGLLKQQTQETKSSLKRKQMVKLCDIYADWIEDMTLLPSPSYK